MTRFSETLVGRTLTRPQLWPALGVGLALLAAGCSGDDGRVPVYPVKGKVSVGGEAPVGALVVLYPAAGAAGADHRPSAKVEPDGTFSLTTYDAGDGAPVGDYTATIQWNKLVKRGNDFVAGPDAVPPAYTSPEKSPWKIKVEDAPKTLDPVDIKK